MTTRQAAVTAALRRARLIPVIVIDDPKNAVPLASALLDGGLPIAEITLRTPRALEALRRIADEKPEMNAGAGTVLNVAQAKQVREAGGKFAISPGFSRAVVDYCLEHDFPVYPGVATASEIEAALDAGVNLLKLWPIATLGGIPYLQFLNGPFAGVEFNPSGGLDGSTFGDYLKLPNVVACGGPWMTPSDWISGLQFDRIRDAVRDAVSIVSKQSSKIRAA
ncbi:MAG TPA: bifunctional 4-hydroxy-2-oxoglutarate aldolase/2-dehydro-3-deoxy-phosphogluconate aldolase [Gemmatimonadaceae bacterium]|jgi:2-dehydro-3-deoxyphosphogluconate aldolase/(4S)-4-hydroxy-2-oxoglutarate aldolase|nr:bifunctional 4-hydroxy-2-oxoglutarate aldolase/2-dehydro-3-deoxy-phosphogluconate aldolase [Gemmatimonadaceae bacterium]